MRIILNVMYPEKQYKPIQAGVGALSHLESSHAIPFSPQNCCSPCEFVHNSHSTQAPLAGVCISFLIKNIGLQQV